MIFSIFRYHLIHWPCWYILQAVVSTALLLLLLGNTLAIAPGDESGECAVPDYPVNIKVLLDS